MGELRDPESNAGDAICSRSIGEGMNQQLRPMALGEILDRTAELYRTHFPLFAGVSAIFAGAMALAGILHLGIIAALGYPRIPRHLEWAYAVALGVQVLLVALIAGLSIAAFNRGSSSTTTFQMIWLESA